MPGSLRTQEALDLACPQQCPGGGAGAWGEQQGGGGGGCSVESKQDPPPHLAAVGLECQTARGSKGCLRSVRVGEFGRQWPSEAHRRCCETL